MTHCQDFNFCFDENYCKICGGQCCRGESGYVFASREELLAIANFLEMDFDTFAKKFLRKVGYRYSFLEKPDRQTHGYACIFFDTTHEKCSIYPLRPKQCKTYPFWEKYKNQIQEVLNQCPATKTL